MDYFNTEDYSNHLIIQEYKCKICKRHQNQFKNKFHVDHNYITNKVRGLLCTRCNLMIGIFESNLLLIPDIVDYLKYSNTGKQSHKIKHLKGRRSKFNSKAGASKKHTKFMNNKKINP